MSSPGQFHIDPFVSYSICLHGLDADRIQIRRDETNSALFIDLDHDHNVSIRIDLAGSPGALDRDRAGLRRLAELATQADQEIAQHQEGTR